MSAARRIHLAARRNVFIDGLLLTLRNGRAVLWTYAFNLALALVFLLRTHGQLAALLNTSLASQSLIGGFDIITVATAFFRIGEGAPGGTSSNYAGIPIYVLLYFLLVPGTLFCYQTAAPARLSTLLQSGMAHFWRFVRITLMSLIVFGIILGPLLALQNKWTAHVEENVVGRPAVLQDLAGLIVIGLIAAILRVYFDLVEVYTVQLGLQLRPATGSKEARPDRRVRRTFAPAWRALRHNFARIYLTFIVLTLLGLSAVIITARVAMHSLAQPRVWPMFLLAQLGLLLMLFMRFWQRGSETVLALEEPILPAFVPVSEPVVPVPVTSVPVVDPVVSYVPIAAPITPIHPLSAEVTRQHLGGAPLDPVHSTGHYPISDPIPESEPPVPSTDPDTGVFRRNVRDPRDPGDPSSST